MGRRSRALGTQSLRKTAHIGAAHSYWRPSKAFAATLAVMLFFAGGLTHSGSSWAARGSHLSLDEPLPQPAWELPLIANGEGTVSQSSFLGRVTYLDFWASWCGPCRLALPALNRLSQEFAPADFGVVAISVDYVDEDALDFLTRYPVDYPVAIDKTGDSGRAFAVAGMPSGYLI